MHSKESEGIVYFKISALINQSINQSINRLFTYLRSRTKKSVSRLEERRNDDDHFSEYIYLLFNKLSLCPYMVNPHLIFVVCTQQISCDIRNFVGRKMAGRFKNVTTSEVNEVINNAVLENTKKATKFAVKIFNGQCINFYCLHFCSRTGKLQLSNTIMQLFQPIFVSSRSLAKTLNEQ